MSIAGSLTGGAMIRGSASSAGTAATDGCTVVIEAVCLAENGGAARCGIEVLGTVTDTKATAGRVCQGQDGRCNTIDAEAAG